MAPTSRSLIAAAACLLALAACGDESGSDEQATDGGSTPTATSSPTPSESSATDEPTSSASAIDGPSCAAVWVAGETLPRGYRGCVLDDGGWQKAEKKPCSFGVPIVTYADRYYAVLGKVINDAGDLKTSKEYRQALSSCQA